MKTNFSVLLALVAAARAQQVCTSTPESHPKMSWSKCTSGGSCSAVQGSVVLDSNWRWLHTLTGTTNCYDGNKWTAACGRDGKACAQDCCVEGADYASTYGIKTSGNSLSLQLATKHAHGTNVGSRVYLMDSADSKYEMFKLLGNEFTFDVDASKLGCGLNGALYFVSMEADGGLSSFSTNKAGAKYGAGYCDSQCPRDMKFIDGIANSEGWESSDENSGVGNLGACCAEMDIWEANKISTAYTPHPCTNNNYHSCKGNDCGGTYSDVRYAGDCDPDGCDFNSYRQGNKTFYGDGASFNVNSGQKVTVVTQFLASGPGGSLSEIRRLYVQNGKVIANSQSTVPGVAGNSLTPDFCRAQKSVFGDDDIFNLRGGFSGMSGALRDGMVLVMSLWTDAHSNMLWLDSTYPEGKTGYGADRGSCAPSSGKPADVVANQGGSTVTFSNIKFGPIGSTYAGGGGGDPPPPPPTTLTTSTTTTTRAGTTSTPTPGTVQKYGQCGGIGYSGPTQCVAGSTCTKQNDWYSQCL